MRDQLEDDWLDDDDVDTSRQYYLYDRINMFWRSNKIDENANLTIDASKGAIAARWFAIIEQGEQWFPLFEIGQKWTTKLLQCLDGKRPFDKVSLIEMLNNHGQFWDFNTVHSILGDL